MEQPTICILLTVTLNNSNCCPLSHVWLFVTPWTAACQASLSSSISLSLLKLMSIELVMPPNHLILCHTLFSCPQSFPALGSFPVSWLLASGGQSIGTSASVFPMNIQCWFPLGWTDWISLQSKGLSESLLQHYNLKASVLSCSAFFLVQLSHLYLTTGKTIALTLLTFVSKLKFLLLNMLSKLVTAFLPRSKHL